MRKKTPPKALTWLLALVPLLLLMAPLGAAGIEDAFDIDFKDLEEAGKTAVPIVGYDDKTGWIFGVAGFLYTDKEPGINAELFAISNLDNFHSATFNYEQRGAGKWSSSLHLLGERAFDNYYGDGDLTSPDDPLLMRVYHYEVRPALLYLVKKHLRVGPIVDYRARRESEPRLFRDESTASFGGRMEWDTRDKLLNTRSGDFVRLTVGRNPWFGGFSQIDLDARRFKRLSKTLVLGSRLVAGWTFLGEPTYLYHYRLGGLDLLRGYKDNRFRGKDMLVIQEELRWYLWKWLSLNFSADLGGSRDENFHQLKVTGQAGLRLGLPPDWRQKLRVDFGAGADQYTFQIQFGEIF